ncbi:MAG: exodeoxyribonuclease VII small subunit [Anaerolineales bacterium]|nr:exodeoxyribonuclease VII small subunit [Anaerolineales bacterium]MCS7246984.1 exodeoxyribonuclease VII small subunit [Anaerolineales bacterium]MDW8160795.1 exodeoxyribonuclease VII small subunit [Anaerolineales bacterium]MDW8447766.1 exodeoxyribonuclease VII small subunit [Anaerolineales bacterium]
MDRKHELAMQNDSHTLESLSFEEAMQQLEQIVTQLESGEQTLQETLFLYQKGQALVQYCLRLLEQAELTVRKLSDGKP